MRKVKWGVIGVAKIAVEKVIPAMQRGETSEIVAIASREMGKAKAAAEKLGIPQAYGSYEDLLADPEIEAIYNPLPNEVHVPWTHRALAAGKHVLCEKPIALDAEEARAAGRGARPLGQAGRRSLHGAFPSPVAACAPARAGRDDRRDCGRSRPSSPTSTLDPGNMRNQRRHRRRRALRHRLLRRSSPRATSSAPSRPGSSPRSSATRSSSTDRLASALRRISGRTAPRPSRCRHAIVAVPAGEIVRHQGPGRDQDPLQRPARPADRNRRSTTAPILGGGRRGRDLPGLRPVHAAGRRLLARGSGRERRSTFRSRTPSPTCASSRPSSAPRRAEGGRSRSRLRLRQGECLERDRPTRRVRRRHLRVHFEDFNVLRRISISSPRQAGLICREPR